MSLYLNKTGSLYHIFLDREGYENTTFTPPSMYSLWLPAVRKHILEGNAKKIEGSLPAVLQSARDASMFFSEYSKCGALKNEQLTHHIINNESHLTSSVIVYFKDGSDMYAAVGEFSDDDHDAVAPTPNYKLFDRGRVESKSNSTIARLLEDAQRNDRIFVLPESGELTLKTTPPQKEGAEWYGNHPATIAIFGKDHAPERAQAYLKKYERWPANLQKQELSLHLTSHEALDRHGVDNDSAEICAIVLIGESELNRDNFGFNTSTMVGDILSHQYDRAAGYHRAVIKPVPQISALDSSTSLEHQVETA